MQSEEDPRGSLSCSSGPEPHMSIHSFFQQIIVECSLCVKHCSGHGDAILNKIVKIFVQVVSGGQFLNIKCNFKTFCYMEVGFDGTKTRCKETS